MQNRRRSPHSTSAIGLGLALTAAFALLLWSCSGESEPAKASAPATTSSPEPPPETAEPTTSTTTTPPTPEQTVKAAYLAIIDRYFHRLGDPDPTDATIAENHTGPSLAQVTKRNFELKNLGQRDRFSDTGPPIPQVEDVKISGSRATVINCVIDDVVVEYSASGVVVNDSVATYRFRSELQFSRSRWKLEEQVVTMSWPDAKGCDR